MFQLASQLAAITGRRSYYFSAEQAPGELRLIANRLEIANPDRIRVLSTMAGGGDIDTDLLTADPPAAFIVDSVSALCGRDRHAAIVVAKRYKHLSTAFKAPSFLIAHMNRTATWPDCSPCSTRSTRS